MGAGVVAGSILGGLGLIGGTATSVASNSYNAHLQEEQNAENRNFNAEQAEKQRVWSTNERLAAQAYNTSEREAAQKFQIDSVKQNILNSVTGLRAAGVNPNVGSSSINSGASGSSPGSVSPGSGAGASYGTGATGQVVNLPQMMSSAGDLINALSKSKETEANLPLIRSQVDYMLKKIYGQEKANELSEMYVQFERANFNTKLKKSFEELTGLILANANAQKQGKVFESTAELNKAMKDVQDQVSKLHGQELIKGNFFLSHLQDMYDMDMKVKGSQVAANYGSAESSYASAQKMYSEKDYQDMINSIKRGSVNEELNAVLSSYASQSQENKAKTEEFKTMLHRYETLNKNNENGAADYLNYLMWYVKEQMPSLPIVPFLKLGK